MNKQYICKYCKKEFENNSGVERLYCSNNCLKESQKLNALLNEVSEFQKQIRAKDNIHMRTLESKRQLESKFFKKKVREYYDNKCVNCGKRGRLEIHHTTYKIDSDKKYSREKNYWEWLYFEDINKFHENVKRLKLLCPKCHYAEHKELKEETGSFMPKETYDDFKPKMKKFDIKKTKSQKLSIKEIMNFKHLSKRESNPILSKFKDNKEYPNQGKRWSIEEENILKKVFNEKQDLKPISKLLGRTILAICGRLNKLKLIYYNSDTGEYYINKGKILYKRKLN